MLYDYPEYYEVAFSFRDIASEAGFLRQCISLYSHIDVQRILEIGCGPAPHAGELTKLGYSYSGLDINRNMLDYAAWKWRHLTPRIQLIRADMVSFESNQSVDFAFVMLGSLYLNSLEQMNSHFDSLAGVLRTGGLYFLDWCIQFDDPLQFNTNSYKIKRDDITIQSSFDIRLLDQKEQMYEEVWTVDVNDGGRLRSFSMTEHNKAIMPDEFLAFVESRDDFEFVGWWSAWDFSKKIEAGAKIDRPLALLRRTDKDYFYNQI